MEFVCHCSGWCLLLRQMGMYEDRIPQNLMVNQVNHSSPHWEYLDQLNYNFRVLIPIFRHTHMVGSWMFTGWVYCNPPKTIETPVKTSCHTSCSASRSRSMAAFTAFTLASQSLSSMEGWPWGYDVWFGSRKCICYSWRVWRGNVFSNPRPMEPLINKFGAFFLKYVLALVDCGSPVFTLGNMLKQPHLSGPMFNPESKISTIYIYMCVCDKSE